MASLGAEREEQREHKSPLLKSRHGGTLWPPQTRPGNCERRGCWQESGGRSAGQRSENQAHSVMGGPGLGEVGVHPRQLPRMGTQICKRACMHSWCREPGLSKRANTRQKEGRAWKPLWLINDYAHGGRYYLVMFSFLLSRTFLQIKTGWYIKTFLLSVSNLK